MTNTEQYHLYLDEEETGKLKTATYSIYRSEEMTDGRPAIDGMYIQNAEFLLSGTPGNITITLKY